MICPCHSRNSCADSLPSNVQCPPISNNSFQYRHKIGESCIGPFEVREYRYNIRAWVGIFLVQNGFQEYCQGLSCECRSWWTSGSAYVESIFVRRAAAISNLVRRAFEEVLGGNLCGVRCCVANSRERLTWWCNRASGLRSASRR